MSTLDPKRAKTARGRRALEKMMPKLNENPRSALMVRGQKTSAMLNSALTDLFMLKKPHAKHFTRHNAVHPFEDAFPLEFLCQKNDASLFAFGTHSKKRPNNLVLGRMFDHHVLDMFELGVDKYRSMAEFVADVGGGSSLDAKPVLLFSGAEWDHDPTMSYFRAMLLDFFHQQVVENISPLGVEQVLSFTAVAGRKVHMRVYMARLLKSSEATGPYVDLREMGPSFDWTIRRTHQAAPDVMKAAMTRPKADATRPKKVKNIERSKLLGKQGRLRMEKQDLKQMATARFKSLRPTPKSAAKAEAPLDQLAGGADATGGTKAMDAQAAAAFAKQATRKRSQPGADGGQRKKGRTSD